MLLKRRQPDSPATALNKFCSIRTSNGIYTEFGIDPPSEIPESVFILGAENIQAHLLMVAKTHGHVGIGHDPAQDIYSHVAVVDSVPDNMKGGPNRSQKVIKLYCTSISECGKIFGNNQPFVPLFY